MPVGVVQPKEVVPKFVTSKKYSVAEEPMTKDEKIILFGGAGLVGQNLVIRLKANGYTKIVVLDKHRNNLNIARKIHPHVTWEFADLAEPGNWQRHLDGTGVAIMLQAQIGGDDYWQFVRNNIDSTRLLLNAIKTSRVPYLVHVSSSAVESIVEDFYTDTKRSQERMVLESGLSCPVLRPTLMFGWFDRKHLGWLSRFMDKTPIFPIPGHGRYIRQPLYVGDFCNIIISCIKNRIRSGVYNISGYEKIDYIDIIREIKRAKRSHALILPVSHRLFSHLLWVWSWFDKNPPFTTQQLAALSVQEEFEVIDWPGIFGVPSIPFKKAIDETFGDPRYSNIVLDF